MAGKINIPAPDSTVKSQSMRQKWVDAEKNQLFNMMSQSILKLALQQSKGVFSMFKKKILFLLPAILLSCLPAVAGDRPTLTEGNTEKYQVMVLGDVH